MGAPKRAGAERSPTPAPVMVERAATRNFGTTRRRFTKHEILLLLAGDYHGFAKVSGLSLTTARRYGHTVRHSAENRLAVKAVP